MPIKLRGLSEIEVGDLIPDNTILLGYRGSIAHGMYLDQSNPESSDDKDIMGVCIPSIENYFGLEHFEQKEIQYLEWDSVVYELKKFVRLLEVSNPNVLSLLWLRDQDYIEITPLGALLVTNRSLFISKKIYYSFTGYAYGQLKRMTHFTYEGYMGAKRKALADKYGYDTKNAAHCIRLLRMGIEFLKEGELHVYRHDAPQLLEIKTGKWRLEQVQKEATYLFRRAEAAYDESKLPNAPDRASVNKLLISMLSQHWRTSICH